MRTIYLEDALPNGTPIVIARLEQNLFEIKRSIRLQQRVLAVLPEHQTLIHPQNAAGFRHRNDGIHAITLGVFEGYANKTDPRLIGQVTLRLSPDPTISLCSELQHCAGNLGCTEGFMVDPAYWGNGLLDKMLHCIHAIGKQEYGLTGFISCVDATNKYSYNNLLKNGYLVTSAYIDAADNGKSYGLICHPQVEKMARSKHYVPTATYIDGDQFNYVRTNLLDPNLVSTPAVVIVKEFHPQFVTTHEGGQTTSLTTNRSIERVA